MKIRTRIIGASLAVIAVANIIYSVYFIDRERNEARARLQTTIEETKRLLGSVIAGPLYDGNIEQLSGDLDSFLLNPDIVRIALKENRGDIAITRERGSPGGLGERIEDRVSVHRGIDELGTILVTYTTANIERRLLQSRNELTLLSLASVLGLAVVTFLAARGLTKPIDRLTEAARAMADGKLDQHIEPGGVQEVVVLGQSFVRMRDAIREKMADLAENNRRLHAEMVQRHQAEQERDRLVSILEATTDIVSMADPTGKLLYLNRAGRSKFGIAPGGALDAVIPQAHPEWASNIILERGLPAAVRDGVWSGETAVLARDGSEIPVSQVILSHKDAQGRLLYLSTIMRDITERKRTETALRVKDDAIAASINGIAFADLTGTLTYVNRAFLRMWGYDREEEVIGRPALEFWVDPGEAGRVLGMLTVQDDWSGELRARRPDGSPFVALLSAAVIRDGDGQPVQLMASFVDVTERKRAEEALRQSDDRLRQAVRVSEIGIFDHDQVGDRIYWSPEQRAIYGWSPDEPVPLAAFFECVHPEDRGYIALAVARAHDPQGSGLFDVEHRIVRRDGQTRWLRTRAQTFFAADGGASHPVRTVGAVLDITERKEAEQSLRGLTTELEARVRERTAELEAANQELEAFAYSVSHDLRAPLRAIDGFSRVLVEDHGARLDAEARDHLERVRKAVQRMGNLIDDLLKLARVSRAEMRPDAVDLTQLATEVVAELRGAAPTRQVEVSIAPGLRAHGDRQLLQVVLYNLIENAWKYTGKTVDAVIELGAARENDETVYYVHDNGAGFDMQYAGKLFGAFQRLHSEREFPGTGVGLATVARIIHRHGGRVWAASEPGKGATFFFTVARQRVASRGATECV